MGVPRSSFVSAALLCVAIALGAAAASGGAVAAAADADDQELKAHKLFAAGDYRQARDIYVNLYAETLHPTYLRNIGRCQQNLGEADKAIGSFREYLRKAKDLTPAQRQEIEGHIAEMEELKRNVMIVGSCASVPGSCGSNNGMLLSPTAFGDVASSQSTPVTWRYVVCPVSGPVYARLDPTFSAVVILNHAYGIAKVESLNDSNNWVLLNRQPSNYWGASGVTVSGHALRVTDVNGSVVSGQIAASNNDQPLAAQFPMCVGQ